MRKDYIGTLEAIELGETVILPVDPAARQKGLNE